MKLDATIVVPTIVIMATLIVGWILAWGDIREYKKQIRDLTNDFWQEHDLAVSLIDEIYWLETLNPLTKEESSLLETRRKRIKEAPAGDERSPQSESSSWQVQSYYASHPSQTGKNPQEIDFGKKEWWHLNAR